MWMLNSRGLDMLVHYVIFLFYNFLINEKGRVTTAAVTWSPDRGGSGDRPGNLVVFKNYAITPQKSPNEDEIREWKKLAEKHLMEMSNDENAKCSLPRPKVIKVKEVHHHASKRFLPNCVILHRCDDKSGCCDDDDKVCTAVKKQRVAMYFYVVGLQPSPQTSGSSHVQTNLQVEKLYFSNHTKCECRQRKIRVKSTPPPPMIGQRASGVGSINIFHQLIVTFIVTTKFLSSL